MFSVLVCIYRNDNIEYFIDAYTSILNQDLLPSQIVLVIDGWIPNNLNILVNTFKKKSESLKIEFEIVKLKDNLGHGLARRNGIDKCKYDIVAIADADDINHKQRIIKQINFLKKYIDISIVGSQIVEIDSGTKVPISKKTIPVENGEIIKYLKTRCPFNQMSVMFRKKDVVQVGNYVDFYHNEDYHLWIRMYLNGFKFANLPEVLVSARVNPLFYNRRGGYRYFISELKIQNILLKNRIIILPQWLMNICIRLIVQIILPSVIRGWFFKKFFRKETRSKI